MFNVLTDDDDFLAILFEWFFDLLNTAFDYITEIAISYPFFFSISCFFILSLIAFFIRWLYYGLISH